MDGSWMRASSLPMALCIKEFTLHDGTHSMGLRKRNNRSQDKLPTQSAFYLLEFRVHGMRGSGHMLVSRNISDSQATEFLRITERISGREVVDMLA